MSYVGTGLLFAAVAGTVVFALQKFYLPETAGAGSQDPPPVTEQSEAAPVAPRPAPEEKQTALDTGVKPVVESLTAVTAGAGLSPQVLAAEREAFHQRFDLSTLGVSPLSDGDINAIVAYLKNDPLLLEQFLQQYRENTDPERAKRLAQILDGFDDDSITAVAEDLVFSGEVHSLQAGLDLLADQQVNNPAARELVSQVLEVESDPQVLVSALNALAKPGAASAEQTDKLLNQFVLHASSDDVTVRGHSLSLMERWAGGRNMNEHYLNGLSDSSEHVRRTAVYLLGNSQHADDSVITALREVLENSGESQRLRGNALASLKKLGLGEEEEALYRKRIAAGN